MKKNINKVLISIIVPVYNVKEQLPRCIESLINQSYKNIEIILVNDGSTDESPLICENYKKIDSRIKVIHKKNGGLSEARNFGIYESKGKYILFVDSDDFIEKDACERFIKILKNKKVDIIVGEAREINKNKISYMKHSNLINEKEYSSIDYIKKSVKVNEWYAPSWLNLYRKEFIDNNYLYFKKGILHEDMQILPIVFLKAEKIIYMKDYFYNYVIREGSITQEKNKKKLNCLLDILREWKERFDKIEEKELKELLYGVLIKQYLFICKSYNIKIAEKVIYIDKKFMLKNALNNKERIKVLLYILFPKIYFKL